MIIYEAFQTLFQMLKVKKMCLENIGLMVHTCLYHIW
jgi:hypothetical protein